MRILAFAYACEPGRGSEPGAGWAWSRMLARLGETWVITRREYQVAIEHALQSVAERDNLTFVYVDLPERFRSWQRGLRGLRVYYLLWQIAALREARRLQRSMRFDIVWHLTWANAWLGSLAALAGRPFIYGPVGGCVDPPWRLLPQLGLSGAAYEIARATARGTARYLNPVARLAWNQADLILVQNVETRDWFPRAHRGKARLFPNSVFSEEFIEADAPPVPTGSPSAVYAGRLLPWKGVFLALNTLRLLPDWRLIVCGTGPDEPRLRRLAKRLGLLDRTEFRGWVRRSELARVMREADVFLFPSLHDDSPLAIAEARAVGLPVVCLARGGPRVLAGPDGTCVASSGGVTAIAQRLADGALASFDRRRNEDIDESGGEVLLLGHRAEALRELLAEAIPWLLGGARAPEFP
jgi:glycosyltransferase involved in cell wall biosynthesis